MATSKKTIIVGLSGPSSSGKTTLARLLREIYNINTPKRSISLFILHEDDFYKTDKDIPVVKTPSGRELQDWDCAEAIDLDFFETSLKHIHTHGSLPADLYSKEDQNQVGDSRVPDARVKSLKSSAETWFEGLSVPEAEAEITICLLDGFLLFSDPAKRSIPSSIIDLMEVRMFLRSTYELTKARREARSGYVTLEGFWEDPEGYVDEIVWPNYVREHAWMFQDGDVDHGDVNPVVARESILIGPGKGDAKMEDILEWGCHTLEKEVERLIAAS